MNYKRDFNNLMRSERFVDVVLKRGREMEFPLYTFQRLSVKTRIHNFILRFL